jgi:hypothetical protein
MLSIDKCRRRINSNSKFTKKPKLEELRQEPIKPNGTLSFLQLIVIGKVGMDIKCDSN